MPTIAQFYGIFIQMYFRYHNPPHFHARYGRAKAIFSISNGEMIAGELPPTAIKLVKEWAAEHQAELQGNWDRGQADGPFERIAGPDHGK